MSNAYWERDIVHTCQRTLKNMFYPKDGGGVFLKALVPIQETTYFCIVINILRSSDEILVVLIKSEACRNLMFLKIML